MVKIVAIFSAVGFLLSVVFLVGMTWYAAGLRLALAQCRDDTVVRVDSRAARARNVHISTLLKTSFSYTGDVATRPPKTFRRRYHGSN
jgi:hypothetical protein